MSSAAAAAASNSRGQTSAVDDHWRRARCPCSSRRRPVGRPATRRTPAPFGHSGRSSAEGLASTTRPVAAFTTANTRIPRPVPSVGRRTRGERLSVRPRGSRVILEVGCPGRLDGRPRSSCRPHRRLSWTVERPCGRTGASGRQATMPPGSNRAAVLQRRAGIAVPTTAVPSPSATPSVVFRSSRSPYDIEREDVRARPRERGTRRACDVSDSRTCSPQQSSPCRRPSARRSTRVRSLPRAVPGAIAPIRGRLRSSLSGS